MLGWIAYILTITGVFLNIFKNKWCFVVWSFASGLFVWKFVMAADWSSMTRDISFVLLNVYGFVKWRKEDQHKRVTRMWYTT